MSDTIKDKKFVELSYKVTDLKTGNVLVTVEYPIGYVHGANDILAPDILEELKGKSKLGTPTIIESLNLGIPDAVP